jgi:hypothetical protein
MFQEHLDLFGTLEDTIYSLFSLHGCDERTQKETILCHYAD